MSDPTENAGAGDKYAAAKARAAEVVRETGTLTAAVYSASDRRCPFFKVFSESEDDEVDAICDIRTQTFSDLPPFGPKDLTVCRLCIDVARVQQEADQFETMQDSAEQDIERAKDAADENEPDR